jgi:flagellar biosynthetic protein FlhB
MADSGQRTEKPTEQRLRKARQEGQFPASKEFVSSVQFLSFVALAVSFGSVWFLQMQHLTRTLLRKAFSTELTPHEWVALVRGWVVPIFTPLLWGGAVLVVAVVMAQLATTGLGVSLSKLAPDVKRLDFLSRIKNLPGQNGPPFLQALALLPLIGLVVYHEIAGNLDAFLTLPWMSPQAGTLLLAASVKTLLWRVGALFLVAGLIDLFWQRRRYTRQLRMTKQEVREEAKEQQGNPQIKMRIRRIQRDLARRQMMKEVPTATAVIVNPTHYAVAIRYSLQSGSAPKVVAKGKNHLALRIRKLAMEHQVPIVENPPLAQALYKSAKVGQEIPASLYRAVAEILAYIYRLMGGRLPGS